MLENKKYLIIEKFVGIGYFKEGEGFKVALVSAGGNVPSVICDYLKITQLDFRKQIFPF